MTIDVEKTRAEIDAILATREQFWKGFWERFPGGRQPDDIDGPPILSQQQRVMLGHSLGERKARHIQAEMREGRSLRERARGSGWVVRNS